MNGGEGYEEPRESHRRRVRRRSEHSPGVAEVRRKMRHQGAFGWLRKSAFSQRSPLLTLVLIVIGIGLTAAILTMMTKSTPTLPPGFDTPPRNRTAR